MTTAEVRADSIVDEMDGLIVKCHRGDAAARARREAAALVMLRAKMPEHLTVPRLVRLDEAAGCVIMERAPGTTLETMLRDWKRRRDPLPHLAGPTRRAGEWLRAMQEATRVPGTAVARAILREQTQLAMANAAALRRPLRDRVMAGLDALRARIEPRTLVACSHHGDYWPGNVFLDGMRTTVIDFEGHRLGLPLEDAAYFLIQLTLLLPRHARLVPPLRAAFLAGCGDGGDADALRLFTMTKALHLVARDAAARHPFLLAFWMRRALRTMLRGEPGS